MTKRIKMERLNPWLTFGANIGVILGLLVLIVEVRQNANLSRAAMEADKNKMLVDIELNIAKPEISEVWIKSIRNPEALTDAEMRTVEALLVSTMLQWDLRFQMEKAGLASRGDARQHVLNSARYYFGSRFGKKWWSFQGPGWEGTPMIEVAGPIIDGVDENFLADYMDELRIAPKSNPQNSRADTANTVVEARRFMAAYASDLRGHDTVALANRYDRNGAYMILNGKKTFRSFEEINTVYKEQWAGPTRFEWFGLTYTVTDEDSVLVMGQFNWGTKSDTQRFSYTGLLKREQGKFHILLEDEVRIETIKREAKP
jgi:Nuclear transport factor 2 (NTF2) domain